MNEETLDIIIIGLEEEEEGLSFFSFSHKQKILYLDDRPSTPTTR